MSAPARPVAAVWSHRLAVLLCLATLVLLLVGGVVTTTGAALAVPDWPTTFGYPMFLYPWSKMAGGIFWEHSHRLIGSVVGLLTVALALLLGLTERRRWLRWLGVAAVVLVSVQGVLGGLRVVLLKETLAGLHGVLAPAFFALTVGLALVTSRGWVEPAGEPVPAPEALGLSRLALLTTGGIYLQIALGAWLTHLGGPLAPHLAGAAGLALLGPVLGARVLGRHAAEPRLVRPAVLLVGLLALQLLLGLGAYLVRFAALPPLAALAAPIAHRLAGALLLATGLVLTLRILRLRPAGARGVEGGWLSQRIPA
ncbi:MAG: COX15/CtaA family protein [Candidatus Rokubacteria bacterium]|nr:COX15/CtaA family protein [Candidatus Rokubacteria bacterium]